jgi:GT2 family glycosyltransferase
VLLASITKYVIRKMDKKPWVLQNLVELDTHHIKDSSKQQNDPKVSVIIPTKDKLEMLSSCITSLKERTDFTNLEIIVVDNRSIEPETISYLNDLKTTGVQVIKYDAKFNYSEICNFAVHNSSGDYLCFLNNDTRVITSNWLKSMVEHASKPEVGIVGAVLTFPHGKVQHMGVALQYTGVAGHPGRNKLSLEDVPEDCYEVSVVTFACAVVSADKFKQLGGLDPNFPVAFNDVDISIRARNAGYKNVVCTKSQLLHLESQTRKRASSWGGFVRGARDVLLLLRKHQNSLTENFFARRVLLHKSPK